MIKTLLLQSKFGHPPPVSIPKLVKSASTTHTQKIQNLYRKSLRLTLDWTSHSKQQLEIGAAYIRKAIEQHRHERRPETINDLVKQFELQVYDARHFAPYAWPWQPTGSSYQRNLPTPDYIKPGIKMPRLTSIL